MFQVVPLRQRMSDDRAKDLQYLVFVIVAAIRAHNEGHTDYAADRLRRVLEQAESIDAHDLVCVARYELNKLEQFTDNS